MDLKYLNRDFIKEAEEFELYLKEVKTLFDDLDKNNPSTESKISQIEKIKEEFFKKCDNHFDKIWGIAENFSEPEYKIHQKYYFNKLSPLLGFQEINKYIYEKPLGYAGDYVTMNYIYDYHDKYLGKFLFEMLVNNYTCNIPISKSNLKRKEYLKDKILKAIAEKGEDIKIASIGSGPARELVELLEEKKINKFINFTCLDFEKKALEYVKKTLAEKGLHNQANLNINYVNANIVDVIRKISVKEKIAHQDFIYSFGLFDYLSDRISSKITEILFASLNKPGTLLICNASRKNCKTRAYYEMLGEWYMNYRDEVDLLKWTEKLDQPSEIYFEYPEEKGRYLFLVIKK